jgi:hypothetical protein
VLVVFVVLAPFLFAAFPTNYWRDGRYAVFFAPVVALFVAAAAVGGADLLARAMMPLHSALARGVAAVLVVSGGLCLTLGAMSDLAPYVPSRVVAAQSSWTTWQSDPTGWLDPVIDSLTAAGIHDLYAGYWVGTVVDFESKGSVTTTDLPYTRYQPYTTAVESATKTAWLFLRPGNGALARAELETALVDPGCVDNLRGCLAPAQLESFLRAAHDPFTSVVVGAFVEVVPGRPVDPHSLLASLAGR